MDRFDEIEMFDFGIGFSGKLWLIMLMNYLSNIAIFYHNSQTKVELQRENYIG